MRRLTASLIVFIILTAPAWAQGGRARGAQEPTAAEIAKKKDAAEIERRYKETIKATPTPAAANKDPWGFVRSTGNGKSAQQ